MCAVYEQLKTKEVLKSNDVIKMQRYIKGKRPEYSRVDTARILANAIHQIIERNIQDFNDAMRVQIRNQVIQKAVTKNIYDIHAGDILSASLSLVHSQNWNEKCNITLTDWVNQQQDIFVSPHVMNKLINNLKHLEREIDEDDILELFRQVETEDEEDNTASLVLSDDMQMTASSSFDENIFRSRRKKREEIFSDDMMGMIGPFAAFRFAIRKLKENLTSGEKVIPRLVMVSCLFVILAAVQPMGDIKAFVLNHLFDSRIGLAQQADISAVGWANAPNYLPVELRYKAVNKQRIKSYLEKRNSLLADDPYLSTIMETSRAYDVNPLLLLAITGQEQGFVPRMNENANLIANNPYNVYRSWQHYNTNIQDSTIIVAQTINSLSKNRPEDVPPLAWINRKYAQDQNWWIGVSRCWQEMEKETSLSI